MSTKPVWTIFGDMSSTWPDVYTTGEPGNHIRSYVVGVFDADADLSNVTPDKVRVGVVYYGTETSGTVRTILNGAIISEAITTGCDEMRLSWETSFTGDPAPFTHPGILDFLETKWRVIGSPASFFFLQSDYITDFYSFDTRDCKIGWYVDQATGLGDGVLAPLFPHYCNPPMMYTAPHPQDTFSYYDVMATIDPLDPLADRLLFDTVADVDLNVNLGGHADSWEYAGSLPAFDSVYYSLGYPIADTEGDPIYVDGGTIDESFPGEINNWSQTNSMNVSGDRRLAYFIADQTIDAPVATAGPRVYPNVNATYGGSFNGFIQALNFGLPVLYEQWYTTDLQAAVPAFWTQRLRATEVL